MNQHIFHILLYIKIALVKNWNLYDINHFFFFYYSYILIKSVLMKMYKKYLEFKNCVFYFQNLTARVSYLPENILNEL